MASRSTDPHGSAGTARCGIARSAGARSSAARRAARRGPGAHKHGSVDTRGRSRAGRECDVQRGVRRIERLHREAHATARISEGFARSEPLSAVLRRRIHVEDPGELRGLVRNRNLSTHRDEHRGHRFFAVDRGLGAQLQVVLTQIDDISRALRVVKGPRLGHRDLQRLHAVARSLGGHDGVRAAGGGAHRVAAAEVALVPLLVGAQVAATAAHHGVAIAVFGALAGQWIICERGAIAGNRVRVHQAEIVTDLLVEHGAAGGCVVPRAIGRTRRSAFAADAAPAAAHVIRADVLHPMVVVFAEDIGPCALDGVDRRLLTRAEVGHRLRSEDVTREAEAPVRVLQVKLVQTGLGRRARAEDGRLRIDRAEIDAVAHVHQHEADRARLLRHLGQRLGRDPDVAARAGTRVFLEALDLQTVSGLGAPHLQPGPRLELRVAREVQMNAGRGSTFRRQVQLALAVTIQIVDAVDLQLTANRTICLALPAAATGNE